MEIQFLSTKKEKLFGGFFFFLIEPIKVDMIHGFHEFFLDN